MKKVLVIGDSCLDVFQYGKCNRISPEAPVPIFEPTNTESNVGMAENVLNNLLALNVHVDIITNDSDKPTKVRYVDEVSNQMLLRIDTEDKVKPLKSFWGKLKLTHWDGVVISDYNKGFLDEEIIFKIVTYCKGHKIPTFLDTKKKIGSWANDINFIKINEKEYLENEDELYGFKNHLITTLGKEGAKHYDKTLGTTIIHPIKNKSEVRDLSGAGDTFLASFVADYLENNDIASAINFANRCASYVVTQKGVVVVDNDKI